MLLNPALKIGIAVFYVHPMLILSTIPSVCEPGVSNLSDKGGLASEIGAYNLTGSRSLNGK